MESNSTPNRDSIPNILAIFPSKTSNEPAIMIKTPALKGWSLRIRLIDKNPRNILSNVKMFGIK
jgi:hypothetical protein